MVEFGQRVLDHLELLSGALSSWEKLGGGVLCDGHGAVQRREAGKQRADVSRGLLGRAALC
jgi:hypothetical protein